MRIIYIAGAVSGLDPQAVEEKFTVKSMQLSAQGYSVINPVRLIQWSDTHDGSWTSIMKECIREMMKADEVHLLPCWQQSRGACLERDLALRLGMPIVYPN